MSDEVTFDLEEPAAFLKMSPEALRRKAKAGEMPGTLNLKKAVTPPRIQRVTVASRRGRGKAPAR